MTIAAVGTNGMTLVVWGLGETEEQALADALAQDFGGDDCPVPNLETYPISDEDVEEVMRGAVAARPHQTSPEGRRREV